jgi:LPS export ABC transporter protein LptC
MMMSNHDFRAIARTRPMLAALGVAAVAACSQPLETRVAGADVQEMEASNVFFGMTSYLTSSGVREGRVQADTAYMFADSAVALLRRMTITFYDEDGREIATVTGQRGRWRQDDDAMVARGDVVLLVYADSSRIESQEIHYDPNAERIWSDSATVQTLQDGTVTSGSSFESDITFENILIRDIRGGGRRVFE